MYVIESLISGKWILLSRKTYSKERAQNLVAYLNEETGEEDSRYVPVSGS